jgi:hypothetical protein
MDRIMRAVTIGWNSVNPSKYGGWAGPLPDCELDAERAASMLRSKGIETLTLLTKNATIDACRNVLRKSLDGMKDGDWLIVWISGHGGQKRDRNGDEKDGLDEYVCAYDGPILDDTINEWLNYVPSGVRVLWICDTCHSGTMMRSAPAFESSAIPTDFKGQLILISGCTESGISMSSGRGGVLSTSLLKTGPEARTPKSWFDAAKAIIDGQEPQYVEYGNVTEDFRNGAIILREEN